MLSGDGIGRLGLSVGLATGGKDVWTLRGVIGRIGLEAE